MIVAGIWGAFLSGLAVGIGYLAIVVAPHRNATQRDSSVAAARRSAHAERKSSLQHNELGNPERGFRGTAQALATLTGSWVCFPEPTPTYSCSPNPSATDEIAERSELLGVLQHRFHDELSALPRVQATPASWFIGCLAGTCPQPASRSASLIRCTPFRLPNPHHRAWSVGHRPRMSVLPCVDHHRASVDAVQLVGARGNVSGQRG